MATSSHQPLREVEVLAHRELHVLQRTVSEENSAPCWNRTPQRRSIALPLRVVGVVEVDAEHLDRALRASAAGR